MTVFRFRSVRASPPASRHTGGQNARARCKHHLRMPSVSLRSLAVFCIASRPALSAGMPIVGAHARPTDRLPSAAGTSAVDSSQWPALSFWTIKLLLYVS
jgi:hypothetical protein